MRLPIVIDVGTGNTKLGTFPHAHYSHIDSVQPRPKHLQPDSALHGRPGGLQSRLLFRAEHFFAWVGERCADKLQLVSAGFGGNLRPSHIFPTAVATRHREPGSPASTGAHSDFIVGPSRDERTALYNVALPVRRGTVANWPEYEKLIFGCLCECAPCQAGPLARQSTGHLP